MAREPEEQRPSQPTDKEVPKPAEDILVEWGPLGTGGIRGEVPGCPTGMARPMGVPKKEKKDDDAPKKGEKQ